jgi:cytochrome c oxidase subunit 3
MAHKESQFADIAQQREAATAGIWVFLGSETLFFGALFVSLAVLRMLHPQAMDEGTKHMKYWLGTINTAILLTSSFTMAVAVEKAKEKSPSPWLWATALLGLAFLGVKALEYSKDWHEKLVPVLHYDPSQFPSQATEIFLFLYFFMTLLHALHLTVGIGLVSWEAVRFRKGGDPESNVPEVVGLYWHYVDLIWIFLYPMIYLIGRS